MRSPTIRDVARRAGVGVGTVSRVLNGSTQVRDETREKVLAAIKELGFSPNSAARQLSGGKTFTIGVVTPFFTYPSFVERLAGIQDVLDESSYDLVLHSIRSPEQIWRRLRMLVGQNRVDGLIILSLPFSEEDVYLTNPQLPVVVVDNDAVEHYPSVAIDNVEGGRLATRYLIEHGHQDIGFIGDLLDNPFGFTSTLRRFEGFKQALAEAGLRFREEWTSFCQHSQEVARQNARRILSLPEHPTAIFVAIDTLAFGVLEAASDLGLSVPTDVAVIGFDDIEAANYVKLTTVRQHLVESGRISARQMLEWLDQQAPDLNSLRTVLPLELVERSTV